MRKLPLFLALTMGLSVAACGDDDGGGPQPGATAFRVVHAAPNAPAVDVYVAGDDSPLITNLAYRETSRYIEVDPGTYDLQVRAAGDDASAPPVFSTGPLTFAESERVTAVAAGLIDGTGDQAFRVVPFTEDFADPDSGNAVVRIVHASPDAPAIAVDVDDDASAEITDLARYEATAASGVQIPADNAVQIGILAGDPLERVTAFTTPSLAEDAELFVIATGLLSEQPRDEDGFALLAVGPDGTVDFIEQNPVVYAMHASPDAPPVDIYSGEMLLVSNLAFGQLSTAVQVPPGTYTLDFVAAGTTPATPAASLETPDLEAGERYLTIAAGFLDSTGTEGFRLISVPAQFDDEDTGNARLGIVHASPDAPAVDIGTATNGTMDSPVLVEDLGYGDVAADEGLQVPPSSLTVGVAPSGESATVAEFDLVTTAGLRGFVVAAGALSPTAGQEPFRLFLVTTSTTPWEIAEVSPNL